MDKRQEGARRRDLGKYSHNGAHIQILVPASASTQPRKPHHFALMLEGPPFVYGRETDHWCCVSTVGALRLPAAQTVPQSTKVDRFLKEAFLFLPLFLSLPPTTSASGVSQ